MDRWLTILIQFVDAPVGSVGVAAQIELTCLRLRATDSAGLGFAESSFAMLSETARRSFGLKRASRRIQIGLANENKDPPREADANLRKLLSEVFSSNVLTREGTNDSRVWKMARFSDPVRISMVPMATVALILKPVLVFPERNLLHSSHGLV